MKARFLLLLCVCAALFGPMAVAATPVTRQALAGARAINLRPASPEVQQRIERELSEVKLAFEQNRGQLESSSDRFRSRGAGYSVILRDQEAVVRFGDHNAPSEVSMVLLGSSGAATASGKDVLPGIVNYYRGADRSRWVSGIPTYERVRYDQVYEGVDVEYYGRGGMLEYDFIVDPFADPEQIELAFHGASQICIDGDGSLVLATGRDEIRHGKPFVYQRRRDSTLEQIAASYVISERGVAFELGAYDRSRELVIDPAIVYQRRHSIEAVPKSIAIDAADNIYIIGGVGMTQDIPATAAFREREAVSKDFGRSEAFVMKLDPLAQTVLYATYLGGDDSDQPASIAVDGAGNAYVVGSTESTDFPVTESSFQPASVLQWSLEPSEDAFLVKISSTGALVYGTRLGGVGRDRANGVAVNAFGEAFVGGLGSDGFPVTKAYASESIGGNAIGFLAKVSADGSELLFSDIFDVAGGALEVHAVTLDSSGSAYFTGSVSSSRDDLETTPGVVMPNCGLDQFGGCQDAFVAKVDGSGTREFMTYLGGNDDDDGFAIELDSAGNILVAGRTRSGDFPVRNALQSSRNDFEDAFYTKLDSSASSILYSTYLGGTHVEAAYSLAVDANDNVTVAGYATGLTSEGPGEFPAVNAWSFFEGGWFLAHFSASNQPLFSSYLGASGTRAAVDSAGNVIVVEEDAWSRIRFRKLDMDAANPTVLTSYFSPRFKVANASPERFELVVESRNILPGCSVTIGGEAAADVEFNDGDRVWGTLPDLPTGTYDVLFTNGDGASFTLPGAYTSLASSLTVTAMSPTTAGRAGGEVITLTGTGFTEDASVIIEPHQSWSYGSWYVSPTEMKFVVPYDIDPGTYRITVASGATSQRSPIDLTITDTGLVYLTPRTGAVAGGTKVSFNGFGFSGGGTVSFGGITVPLGTELGAHAFAPPHAAGWVDLIITTPSQTVTIPNGFLYVTELFATEITPAVGTPAGGTEVTITGTNFQPGARVTFDSFLATNVTVVDDTTIIATTPAHDPSRVGVVVINPDGTSAEIPYASRFRYSGPQIGSVGQNDYGPTAGGAAHHVWGEFFDATCTVYVDGIAAATTFVDQTRLNFVTPAHAMGAVDVTVVNAAGESSRRLRGYRYVEAAPTLGSISPASGPVSGGSVVTLIGTNFTATSRVYFGDRIATSITLVDSEHLSVSTPPSSAGNVRVRVVNADGQGTTATIYFAYLPPPSVTSVSPAAGTMSGGTAVTVTGQNFQSGAAVYFGGVASPSVTFVSATSLTATTPAHSVGDVAVSVTNPDMQVATQAATFRYLPPPPSVSGFSPGNGPPGTTVNIAGSDFIYVSDVRFGGISATSFTVVSATEIDAVVKSGAVTGPITIVSQSGSGSSTTDFVVDPTHPSITAFTPAFGAAGTPVTITGVRFSGTTSVKFSTLAAAFTVDSDTQITATVPSNPLSGPIVITSPGGVGTSSESFVAPPRISSLSPTSARIADAVVINGANFGNDSTVTINGTAASSIVLNSATRITATVPEGASITGSIVVANAAGSATTPFKVKPTITSFDPTSGAAGTSVVITGKSFTDATSVKFYNNVTAAYVVDSDTQITTTVPAAAATGPIYVTTAGGTTASSAAFTPGPRITSFSPATGVPGTTVTINGTGFVVGDSQVTFNGIAATPATVTTTRITVAVPAGATTGKVGVTTSIAATLSASNFGVQPVITGFAPGQGATGTVVTIDGERFTGVSGVKFGGVAVPSADIVFISDTQITAKVPVNPLTGVITVTATVSGTAATGTSAAVFHCPPRVTSFSPTSALPGATVTINGANFTNPSTVTFNGVEAATVTYVSTKKLTAVVPVTATTGRINVTTAYGSGESATNFGVAPQVSSFTPTEGAPGDVVTITGVRFTGSLCNGSTATAGARFNGVNSVCAFVSDTEITAVAPPTGTTGPISVGTNGGTGVSSTPFTYTPRISSFTPATGLPGATVTINGANFTADSTVTFNSVSATTVTFVSAARLTAVVPETTTGPIAVTTPFGSATSATSFGVQPAISSFTPTQGAAGDIVTITGVRFTGSLCNGSTANSGVRFNGVNSVCTFVSDTEITAVAPAAGTTGLLSVTTNGGSGSSSAPFIYAPRISSFTPATGLPGATVTINGANFTADATVTFNSVAATTVTFVSATRLTAVVPDTTTGLITVTTPVGSGSSVTNFGVQPSVSSFTPEQGAPGTVVTITGVRFTGSTCNGTSATTGVKFNGVNSVCTFVNDTEITATAPATGTTGPITVTTNGGSGISAASFNYAPRMTSFTPLTGLPGTTVTINGANYTADATVTFNSVAATTVTFVSATRLTAVVPETTTGLVNVTTPVGSVSSISMFGVQPTINSFAPVEGAPGDVVTITGVRFTGSTCNGTSATTGVRFNGVNSVCTFVSDTEITAIAPPSGTTGLISVTTNGGVGVSTTSFTYTPRISSYTPASGALPGASAAINGANLHGATIVEFNGVPAEAFTVNAAGTQILTTVPATARTGPVRVVTPIGETTGANFGVLPEISSFDPVSGGPGTIVTINGVRFSGADLEGTDGVRFNNTNAASFTLVSDTQITATVPAGATTGPIRVKSQGFTGSSATNFTVGPKITGFTPTKGTVGTAVTINGSNFIGAVDVQFNGVSVNGAFTVNGTGTSITTTVPDGATNGPIAVVHSSLGIGLSTTNFSLPVAISGFNPSSGPQGTEVVITGVNFVGATVVKFNTTNATALTVDSNTQISATVPAGAATGAITVTTGYGSVVSGSAFSVLPTLLSITPDNAPVAGGTTITITGSNFRSGATVQLRSQGSNPVTLNMTNVAVSNTTTLTARTPTSGLSGGALYDVIVTNTDTNSTTLPSAFMADFLDVAPTSGFRPFIEKLVRNKVTAGCGGGNYCPSNGVTRAQMSVFLLVSKEGPSYSPSEPFEGIFGDVPATNGFARWIEELSRRGITSGCGGGNYCPSSSVTRAQMAVFLLVTKDKETVPPDPTGVFADVAITNGFARWIEELYRLEITTGCGTDAATGKPNYCPASTVTRAQMAVFLSTTFGLP